MAEIRLHRIKKAFKEQVVLKELDLVICDGEFFTFLGPSGCGKSTILNIIAGLVPPTGGEIYFDSMVVNELPPRERDVAMVFQSYALYPHMTVFENIAFPLKMKKVGKDKTAREVHQVAKALGLETMLRRKPRELSGGQRQRVALGRAIIRRPKVFLMDEPLSNLDARLRIEMRAELKRLHQELKATIIYVTHDQAEAMGLSERIAVLNNGEVQQCGTPIEIYTKPSNTFVAGFIGSPPMNFYEAGILSADPLRINWNEKIFEFERGVSLKGEKVVLGIRPEDISVYKGKKTDIETVVDILELEGPLVWVDVIWREHRLKCKSTVDQDISPGDRVYLEIPPDRIHIFSPGTGERI